MIWPFQPFHAAIEYATPVRTLYVMYNATHEASNPAFGSLTERWLMAEIEMLHQELEKLINGSRYRIKENIDLLFFKDEDWSTLSEYTMKRGLYLATATISKPFKDSIALLFSDNTSYL